MRASERGDRLGACVGVRSGNELGRPLEAEGRAPGRRRRHPTSGQDGCRAVPVEVVHGRHVGHKIGFPTANLHAVKQFLPQDGVYACAVRLGKKFYRAGMNLGKRPTFQDDDHHRQAEVHILNYYGKLYGKDMKVYLLKYLRPEKKFSSSTGLIRQIRKDLKQVKRISLRSLRQD